MKGYPQHFTGFDIKDGKRRYFATCKCGKKFTFPDTKPKLIPISNPKPFMCPKCGNQVADNTVYY